MIVNLACNFAKKGITIDMVLVRAKRPYLPQLPSGVRVVELKAAKTQKSLWGLARYLRAERPGILISTMHYANEVALLTRALASVPTKVSVCEQNTLPRHVQNASRAVERGISLFAKLFYPWADNIIAASQAIAQDLIQIAGLQPYRIQVIYNPAIPTELSQLAKAPVLYPWLENGSQPSRLMILGSNAGSRPALEELIQELGLEKEVSMPGFVDNPYCYMAKAKVFVLSSSWEGFGSVLVGALAMETPVVSTNCESEPAEILDQGKYGELLPVGDPFAKAKAILKVLNGDVPFIDSSWCEQFSIETIAQQYLG